MTEFAEYLAKKITQKGWNQSELTRKCSVCRATTSLWLSGRHLPSGAALLRLILILSEEDDIHVVISEIQEII